MKVRAVTEEEKREKQLNILRAAASLFALSSFERLSMARVAEAARVAKGTVFLYFPTKEELFLALTERAAAQWLRELKRVLDTMEPGGGSPGEVADAVLFSLKERGDLLRLLAILHTRIEGNIPEGVALRFRRRLAAGVESSAAGLRRLFPCMSSGAARETVHAVYMLLIGVQHFTGPSDFETTFRRICCDYLEGRLSRCAGTT
jgi:AcrR family transcriptional regulator